jgi:hypothetical protein
MWAIIGYGIAGLLALSAAYQVGHLDGWDKASRYWAGHGGLRK